MAAGPHRSYTSGPRRRNEFGYASYEVVSVRLNLNDLGTAEKSPS